MLDCSKNVEVLVGLVLSSILFRPQPFCLDTIVMPGDVTHT